MNFKFLLLAITTVTITAHGEPYLFKNFPELKQQIPHITLCDLPTPLHKLENFGNRIGCKNIFIKRDDLSGKSMGGGLRLYGGNKPRKCEWLFADALKNNNI